MLGRAPLPEPGAPPSHLSSRPGHVPRSGGTGWAGTYAGSSVPRRAAVAGSAQARLRGRRAARARRPGGLPAGGGQRRGERGTRGGWRLGDGRRGRPARRMRAGAGGPLLCGNNNVSCHPAAARPAPPSSGPRPGEGRPLGVRPPSVLPSLRPGPQRPGTWRRRCPIVPRRCRPVPGLRRPRGCLQPPRLPAPRPRPRCHGNRAGPPSPGCGVARQGGPTVAMRWDSSGPTGCAPVVPGGEPGGVGTVQPPRWTRAFCSVHSLQALNAWHSENHLPDLIF